MTSNFALFLTGISLLFYLASDPPMTQCQENPYIVTYDHYLEEPGNLEIEYFSTFGTQRAANNLHAFWMEFEYGVTAWWTTELYLDGQTTFGDSTLFTGSRWENRFRPLKYEHFINPVLYVEYENISAADKILKEVEGHDENTLAAKNLSNSPWEFGYAIGFSRPLALKASAKRCSWCPQNFIAGAEMYGGLGDRHSFGLHETSHNLAPVLAWNLPSDWTLRISPGFGLNDNSHRFLFRLGISREVSGFGSMVGKFLKGNQ